MNAFAQKIRRLFFRLSLREQMLSLAIILVLLLWWMSSELGTWRSQWTLYNSQKFQLQNQQVWLNDRDAIEVGLANALNKLDSEKTYSSSELAGRVDELARSTGLSYSISSQNTEASEDFNTHAVRITIRRAELRPLIEFCSQLQREAPYLVIDSMNISANRSRPTQHDASFIISSFELKNIAL